MSSYSVSNPQPYRKGDHVYIPIDLMEQGSAIGVVQTTYSIPDNVAVAPIGFFATEAVTSDGSLTLSFGTDSSSEPDNWLDDTAVASITLDSLTEGTYDGSSSTLVTNVSGAEVPLYYEIKTAAATAGAGVFIIKEIPLF